MSVRDAEPVARTRCPWGHLPTRADRPDPVSATHAALLLAQGSGRLIRTLDDQGVVAILDPRLITARYGSFLRASLPPMWATTDRAVVLKALKRLSEAAQESAPLI